uniref:Fungal specific transcription factor domain-containing protein n=1 Tax=Colletotrichum fructicola (strain Nara gc5) TaxID=1213859 RepID=L2FR58_COLFN
MLEELLPPPQQEPPPSPSAESDDVNFAIDIFDEETKTGSNYARDCATVLKDLRSLIQRLRLAPQGVVAASGGPVALLLSPLLLVACSTPTSAGPRDYHLHLDHHQQPLQQQTFPNEGDAVYQELMTWVDNNELQVYSNNSYLP